MGGLLGVISMGQFLYYCCLRAFSGNTDTHDPRIKHSCSRCIYFSMMLSVLPLTVVLLMCQLMMFWDVTLFYNCEVNFSFSQLDPVWNKIQYTFECCGQYNYTDWGRSIPRSCCKDPCHGCNASTAFKKGCHPFIKEMFADALRSRTLPLQLVYLISQIMTLKLFHHMLKIVFPKCFSHQNSYDNQTEDDVEAVSVEDHTENDGELEDEIEDVGDDESDGQLLEDFAQNADDDQDTELL